MHTIRKRIFCALTAVALLARRLGGPVILGGRAVCRPSGGEIRPGSRAVC